METANLTENILLGLRPEDRTKRGSTGLVECKNMLVLGDGLTTLPNLLNPFSTNVAASWPYPQLLTVKEVYTNLASTVFTCFEDSIYASYALDVNSDIDQYPWALNAITTYNYLSKSNVLAITAGGTWQLADMGRSFILTNGTNCVLYYPFEVSMGSGKYYVFATHPISSVCYHRGRLLMGGLGFSSFFDAAWDAGLNTLVGAGSSNYLKAGDCFVWWSSIGGGDTLWFFDYSMALSGVENDGVHDINNPMYASSWKENTCGIMPMPFYGEVMSMKPLGKNVVVFGSDGVAALYLAQSTYGMEELLKIGLLSRDSVAGDETGYIFLTSDGNLWSVDGELKIERLGYQEFLKDLDPDTTVMTFDPMERDYYIATADECYVLSRDGRLSQGYRSPTGFVKELAPQIGSSQVFDPDQSLAVWADNSLGFDASFKTDIYSLTPGSTDTLHSVAIESPQSYTISVRPHFRTKLSAAFTAGSWTAIDANGEAILNVTGEEFQLELKVASSVASTVPDIDIDSVDINFMGVGKRTIGTLISGV